jgi:tRNA threonylcarbamoyladenosine modification (KEOPS) complex Cgi121 subunit
VAELRGWSLLVAGVRKVESDAGKLLDGLRLENPDVLMQAFDAGAVFGLDHVLGVVQITIEAMDRGVMIAGKPETELLLRLACTNQISEAIKKAGLKSGHAGCFVCLSKSQEALRKVADRLAGFGRDDSVIRPSAQKKKQISEGLSINKEMDDKEFLDFLLERAAILV